MRKGHDDKQFEGVDDRYCKGLGDYKSYLYELANSHYTKPSCDLSTFYYYFDIPSFSACIDK